LSDPSAPLPGEDSAAAAGDSAAAPPPAIPSRRRRWALFAAWVVAVMLAVAGGVLWLSATEDGLRLIGRVGEELSGGQLRIDEPAGRLRDELTLPAVRWRSETLDLRLTGVRIGWRPAELWRGHLAIAHLTAETVRIAKRGDNAPPSLPESLRFPLTVAIEQIGVGRLELADHARPDGTAASLADALHARLDSDGARHRLSELQARVGGVAITGDLTLAADQPFALRATATVEGVAAGRPLAFDLAADGTLAAFEVQGRARALQGKSGENFAGELRARVLPLAPQPLGEASITLSGVDPAAWVAGAPTANLDLLAELRPAGVGGIAGDGAAALAGRLTLRNRLAGAVDRQRLPLESLRADLRLNGEVLQLSAVDAALAGGGRLRGGGALRDGELALDLSASALDALALHGGLRRTQLGGPLRARLGAHRQSLDLDLRDPRFAVVARLRIDPLEVVVDTLRARAADARLDVSGRLALSGGENGGASVGESGPGALSGEKRGAGAISGEFALRGVLENVDPSRFARLPAARLNAEFAVRGQRAPELALALHFRLRDSRLGGEPLTGGGDVELSGARVRKADLDLDAAGNRVSAKGAFGAPGDRLTVTVAAPRLASLGLPTIAGDLAGSLLLAGSVKAPELSADLRSTRLALAGAGELRGLVVRARLGEGEQGPLSGQIRLDVFDFPGGTVREVAIDADGVRARHGLQARIGLPRERELRLALQGGFSAAASDAAMAWAGTLAELSVAAPGGKPPSILRLTAATPLRLGAASVEAGPAEVSGAGWSLQLDRLRYDGQRWRSAGRWRGLPLLALLTELSTTSTASVATAPPAALASLRDRGEALRLGGEWEIGGDRAGVARGSLPSGRLRLWREGGDLLIGDLPLGLEDCAMSVTAQDGRFDGQLTLRGKRLGEIGGELNAKASLDGFIDRLSPWRGRLRLNAPDLAWAGPVIGEGWRLGGRLRGELSLAGTPAQPRLAGEWRGDNLAVRALDQGMRLERGTLFLQLAGDKPGDIRLILKALRFESDLQPMPRALKLAPGIDVAALTGTPGRLDASGELQIGSGGGALSVRAERVGVSQRPDQWLLVSGDAQVKLGERLLDILGRFRLDAGYWELLKSGAPQLSDDVTIKRAGDRDKAPARLLALNLDADLGRHFLFHGAGVDSRLAGAVKMRSEGGGLPRVTGAIRTVGGRFDAYGQQLDIERGILTFQGLMDNPGLNIRAVRGNLPVEAGVEVTGTVRRPTVRLVSDPEVPDAEKLSWLVLGHSPEQQGGRETAVLLAAAQTLLGGQDGGPLKAVQRGLGIDEFSIASGTLDGTGRRQTSRVVGNAGFGATDTATGQIVSVGKHLSSNMQVSYEQSLTTAGSVVKLTVNLSRNLSLIGRAGSENALDVLWNYRFGR
jgi:translocation and assembly module TamB